MLNPKGFPKPLGFLRSKKEMASAENCVKLPESTSVMTQVFHCENSNNEPFFTSQILVLLPSDC